MGERDIGQEMRLNEEVEGKKGILLDPNNPEMVKLIRSIYTRVRNVETGGHELEDDDFKAAIQTENFIRTGEGKEAIERAKQELIESRPDLDNQEHPSPTVH